MAGCRILAKAGADFIIIPFVSTHFFWAEIQAQIDLPILSIFDAVTETIQRNFPETKTVGLMGTTGTIKGGLFQNRLVWADINTVGFSSPKAIMFIRFHQEKKQRGRVFILDTQ